METVLWAIGILVTIQLAVIGFIASKLWAHEIKCGHISNQLARIDADVERMKQDIGTTDTGMRGDIHGTATMCTQHELRITLLERK